MESRGYIFLCLIAAGGIAIATGLLTPNANTFDQEFSLESDSSQCNVGDCFHAKQDEDGTITVNSHLQPVTIQFAPLDGSFRITSGDWDSEIISNLNGYKLNEDNRTVTLPEGADISLISVDDNWWQGINVHYRYNGQSEYVRIETPS